MAPTLTNVTSNRSVLAALTHARNRYRKMPIWFRRRIDGALGTGIYKRPMIQRGALFIHVPKSAGTSIAQSLFGLPAVGHYTALEARAYDADLFRKLFSFAFVRHPISRSLSAYHYLRSGGTEDVPVAFPQRYAHIQKLSFPEFVEWLQSIDVNASSPVLHTQTKYVCDGQHSILVDFIGRFESIQQDFATISNRLNLTVQLAEYNVSTTSQTEALDSGVDRRLRSIYQADFENFAYT